MAFIHVGPCLRSSTGHGGRLVRWRRSRGSCLPPANDGARHHDTHGCAANSASAHGRADDSSARHVAADNGRSGTPNAVYGGGVSCDNGRTGGRGVHGRSCRAGGAGLAVHRIIAGSHTRLGRGRTHVRCRNAAGRAAARGLTHMHEEV